MQNTGEIYPHRIMQQKTSIPALSFILTILVCLFLIPGTLNAQKTKEQLEKEKKKIQDEINYTNKIIEETKKNQKNSLHQLRLIENKITMRKELILNISEEISLLNKKIKENTQLIEAMEADLAKLREEYAKMIYFAYKNRDSYQRWMFILSSDDFNQAYKRLKYLQQYAQFRERQVEAIKATQAALQKKLAALEKQKAEKEKLVKNKQEETVTLTVEKGEQDKVLVSLKEKEQDLKKKLNEKRKAERELQATIEKLIAEEAKKSSGNAGTGYKLTPEEKLISDQFGSNKGRLPWPTERGQIVSTFGDHEHPSLPGVMVRNDGVTIATTTGSKARAIFDGEVRQVITIPGKHKVVIIRHGEYLSVYSNLKDVGVSTGDKVKTKDVIGTIYTNKEGDNTTLIDLQIWKGTTKLNPSLWLSGK